MRQLATLDLSTARTAVPHRASRHVRTFVTAVGTQVGRLFETDSTPTPFRNGAEVVEFLIPKEERPRALLVRKLPRFAITEDISQLFEESGFSM